MLATQPTWGPLPDYPLGLVHRPLVPGSAPSSSPTDIHSQHFQEANGMTIHRRQGAREPLAEA
jgi:hypothetical protein